MKKKTDASLNLKIKDLVCTSDLRPREILALFAETEKLKQDRGRHGGALKGKCVGLVFQKPSNRTRVSFEVGIRRLGGDGIYLGPDEIQLGMREAVKDVARTLSRYLDGLVVRTFAHDNVVELARNASIPVINGLSDYLHPCQALADVFTVYERKKTFAGVKLAYVGDGNNVLHSLILTAAAVGLELAAATPDAYRPAEEIVRKAQELIKAEKTGGGISLVNDPTEAVKDADFVYTDVWTSMGQEKEREQRKQAFQGYQVNRELLSRARKDALVMHCLPAHRGEEITDEVIDGPQSIVFDQAENRMHAQMAVLFALLSR